MTDKIRCRRYLVAIEGPDGAGKSTLLGRLLERLPDPLGTAEPHDREYVAAGLPYCNTALDRECLFTADRHLHHVAVLDCAEGIVLTDRYYLSTAACQYPGDAVGTEICYRRQRATFGEPDLWVVLDPRSADRADGDPLEQRSRAADYVATLARCSTAPYLVFPSRDEADLDRAVDFLAAYLDAVGAVL